MEMNRIRNDIQGLASRLVAVQEQARALGIVTGDRELIECQKCGLLEDVIVTGQPITRRSSALGRDTGLRYEELSENRFRCPACGSIIHKG
jgi:Zn finger protein HypA/HybF involved in hydrogenase expression